MKAISLFSGIGGFDLGFERAGIETVLQAEIDDNCRAVLERHWPEMERIVDVRDVGHRGLPGEAIGGAGSGPGDRPGEDVYVADEPRTRSIDLVHGGFPCQDISVAGKRAGLGGERSALWFEFWRVLSELRPRWAVIENVPGLLSSHQGRDFATLISGLEELGFGGISWAILDAQNFGVPQRRRRVFVVAGPSRRCTEQVLALCESCGGNPPAGGTQGEGAAVAAPLGTHSVGGYRNDLDHDTYVPQTVGALSDGAHHGGGLNGQDAYSGRVSSGIAGVRRLTPLECERLQGFPDGWTEGQADSHRYRQLGNAVCVPVAEWIGHRIKEVDRWQR